MILQIVVILVAIACGVISLRVSRPLALVLFRAAVLDMAREGLGQWLIRPERARLLDLVASDESRRAPFAGAARLAYSVDQALYLAGPASVAAFAVWSFAKNRRRALAMVAVAWAACSAAVTWAYPQLSGLAWATWPIGPVNRLAHVAAAAIAAASALLWSLRRERPAIQHRSALALAGAELLIAFAGPYAWGGPQGVWTRWTLAGVIYLAADIWIGWHCWREHRSRRGSAGSD